MSVWILTVRYSEEGNFIQCKQFSCDTAQLCSSSVMLQISYETQGNSTAVKWPWGEVPALLQSAPPPGWCVDPCSALLWKHSLWWKGKVCSLQARGELTYLEKFLPPVPAWSVLMQMRIPNLHSFIGLKSTVLIGQNGVVLIVQWKFWWGSDLTGKVCVLVEIQFQELLYRGWLRGRNTVQVDRQFGAGFSLKCGMCERPLFRDGCWALFFCGFCCCFKFEPS